MSDFKVWLIAGACALVLFQLTVYLSVFFHSGFLVALLVMCLAPLLVMCVRSLCTGVEAKLWNALMLAGFLAPFAWFLVLWVLLSRSGV